MTTVNHDFLAHLPLSPKSGSGSDNVSDLSSSYWSARVNTAERFESSHARHKHKIPLLDLKNLPPDSDEEEDNAHAES